MTLGDLDACSGSACAPATRRMDPMLTLSYSPLHLAHRPGKCTGIATTLSRLFDDCFMHALRRLSLHLLSVRYAAMRCTFVYFSDTTLYCRSLSLLQPSALTFIFLYFQLLSRCLASPHPVSLALHHPRVQPFAQ
jgi:hypothetical protein